MQLFDTHCHIDLPVFFEDRPQVLLEARNAGVDKIMVPAIARSGWDNLLELCGQNSQLYPALGLHPLFLDQHQAQHLDDFGDYLEVKKIAAMGEIGLDFYDQQADRKAQTELLANQLEIAVAANLPVILHCRKAYDQLIGLLAGFNLQNVVVHAFNGSLQQAYKLLDLNCKLGFGGMLTYPRSSKLRKLAQDLPLAGLLLETDAPFMTGAAHRGQRNSPAYLIEVLQTLTQLRGQDMDEIADQLYLNSLEIFKLV